MSTPTRFAPSERAGKKDLERQIDYFADASLTRRILDSVPSLLLILNDCRQIVYANQTLLALLAADDEGQVHGLRPGEVLGCVQAEKAEGGCGTAEECSTCGAVLAILASLSGGKAVRECRVTRRFDGRLESLDLEVLTTPLIHEGESFAVFAVKDISHEKRRHALEKIFFHDILNLVGSIKGFSELLRTYNLANKEDIFALILHAADQTIEEIKAQRTLVAVEAKELELSFERVAFRGVLEHAMAIYGPYQENRGPALKLDGEIPDGTLVTDRTLLVRVLGNMIKNAVEASAPAETVSVRCGCDGDRVTFAVHNPACMPREVALQVFQRSFSTKGHGRGLGTYSMRLLTEYLHGEMTFDSTPEGGTVFRASYPLSLNMP